MCTVVAQAFLYYNKGVIFPFWKVQMMENKNSEKQQIKTNEQITKKRRRKKKKRKRKKEKTSPNRKIKLLFFVYQYSLSFLLPIVRMTGTPSSVIM